MPSTVWLIFEAKTDKKSSTRFLIQSSFAHPNLRARYGEGKADPVCLSSSPFLVTINATKGGGSKDTPSGGIRKPFIRDVAGHHKWITSIE